jgi:hypothetical protein
MPLLMMEGGKSTGANSIAVSPDAHQMVIVGGDFMKDTLNADIARAFLKYDHKFEIDSTLAMPNGYKSSVSFLTNDQLIACGTSGVDYSNNKGKKWNRISPLSFHVVKPIPNTRSSILAGSGGRIALVNFE